MAASKRILKLKKKNHSKNPVYLSGSLREYYIKLNSIGQYYISAYQGGAIPKKLQGAYSSFRDAEIRLIQFLEETDKTGLSRYPGCPERRQTNYTQTFLEA